MPAKRLRELLDRAGVKYVCISHSPAYTAQEVAASAHIPGWEVAKVVMVKVDGQMAMAVVPANRKVVPQDLREMLGADRVELATEAEFRDRFPDCEIGAMPPFGNLYGMEVFVAPGLAADEEIAFNAGTHTEVIKMPYREFERLVEPKVLSFST
ncbi:MAG: YbaK/EbsC family protein [Verrucomicrobiae bacterium]|nr:YbaK/EbsC family protein [Verrucomicrobiae bacterium]